jgi:hypothetical protein
MPSICVDVDIEIDDIYDDLGQSDRDRLISWLRDDGHLNAYMQSNDINGPSAQLTNDAFFNDCMSLGSAYYRMTAEEIETVRALVAKYKFY